MKKRAYHVFFTNLANPLKIDIILSLKQGEKSVTEIAKDLEVEQSKLSHALSTLKGCNIVKSKTKGKQRIYFLNKETIIPLLELTDKHAKTFCDKKNCSCTNCRK